MESPKTPQTPTKKEDKELYEPVQDKNQEQENEEISLSPHVQTWLLNTGLNCTDLEAQDISVEEFNKILSLPWHQQILNWLAVDETLRKLLLSPFLCIWPRGNSFPLNSEYKIKWVYGISSFYNGINTVITRVWPMLWLSLVANDLSFYYQYPNLRYGKTLTSIFFTQSDNELYLTSSLFKSTVWPELLVTPLVWGLIKAFYRVKYHSQQFNDERVIHLENSLSGAHYVSGYCNDFFGWLLPWHPLRDKLETLRYALLWDNRPQPTKEHQLQLFQALKNFTERSNKLSQIEALDMLCELAYGVSLKDYPRLHQQWNIETDLLSVLLKIKTDAYGMLRKQTNLSHHWRPRINELFRYSIANYYLWCLGQSEHHSLHPKYIFFWMFKVAKIYLRWRFLYVLGTGINNSIKWYQDKKNCEAEGKLWLYMEQLATYVCSVCGDLPVFYKNIFNIKDCLNDYLKWPRSPLKLASLLARIKPSDDIISLDLSQQRFGKTSNGSLEIILPVIEAYIPNLKTLYLNKTEITSAGMNLLSQFLRKTLLTELHLDYQPIENSGLIALAQSLPFSKLEHLNLEFCDLESMGAAALGRVLNQTHLKSLYLAYNVLKDAAMESIVSGLANSTIQVLNLNSNTMGLKSATILGSVLPQTALQTLNLGNSYLNDMKLAALVPGLIGSLIRVLNLEFNQIGETNNLQGMQLLGNILNSTQLQELTLRGNSLKDINIQALAPGLSNSSVLLLDLSGNQIMHGGAIAISKVLRKTSIIELYLSQNSLEDLGTKILAPGLVGSSIKILYLGSNQIGQAGYKALGSILNQTQIEILELSGNCVSGGLGLPDFVPGLINSSIRKLILDDSNFLNCKITLNDMAALGRVLNKTKIETLGLGGNYLGDEAIELFAPGLANSSVVSLDLTSNLLISVGGANALGQVLRETNLTSLSLIDNALNDEAIENLAMGLPGSSLLYLDLNFNQIGLNGSTALGRILHETKIEALTLGHNLLGDEGAQVLFQGLVGSQVQTLVLSGNKITLQNVEGFATALPHSILKSLDLNLNLIQNSGVENLASVLITAPFPVNQLWIDMFNRDMRRALSLAEPNTPLESLDLAYNHIGNQGAEALCLVLPKTHIEHFRLYANPEITYDLEQVYACQFSSASSLQPLLPYRLPHNFFQTSMKESFSLITPIIMLITMIYLIYKLSKPIVQIINYSIASFSNHSNHKITNTTPLTSKSVSFFHKTQMQKSASPENENVAKKIHQVGHMAL